MTRRTISMPDDLAAKIERVAKKERISFSAAVVELVEAGLRLRGPRRFRSMGIVDGPGDVAERTEEVLREVFSRMDS